jgi:hypothetical protein
MIGHQHVYMHRDGRNNTSPVEEDYPRENEPSHFQRNVPGTDDERQEKILRIVSNDTFIITGDSTAFVDV